MSGSTHKLCLLELSFDLMASILQDLCDEFTDLPKDLSVVDMRVDWERQTLSVKLEHPIFTEVPEGDKIPTYDQLTLRRLDVVWLRKLHKALGAEACPTHKPSKN